MSNDIVELQEDVSNSQEKILPLPIAGIISDQDEKL